MHTRVCVLCVCVCDAFARVHYKLLKINNILYWLTTIDYEYIFLNCKQDALECYTALIFQISMFRVIILTSDILTYRYSTLKCRSSMHLRSYHRHNLIRIYQCSTRAMSRSVNIQWSVLLFEKNFTLTGYYSLRVNGYVHRRKPFSARFTDF